MREPTKGVYRRYLKRLMDIAGAGIGLILLSPLLLLVALLVRSKLGAPILFRQERPGLQETIFVLYKFRTMNDTRDTNGSLLPDGERLTRFGKWLRSTSMDELPELWNVLKGDMSLVGPRPLLVEYLPMYNDRQRRRHDVRPGLTGLAQVRGRNSLSWDEKFEYDIRYVDTVSLCLDIQILIKTIQRITRRDGINSENAATMEPFRGVTTRQENEE